jgi:hypothetical protein
MLSMSHYVTSETEPIKQQRLTSMLAPLVQLLTVMTCLLYPPHLGLLIGTVAP